MLTDKIGIDISKATYDVSLLVRGKPHARIFPNTAVGWEDLDHWLHKLGLAPAHVCLEATGRFWVGIALHLHRAGHRVSVINPAQIKHFMRSKLARSKTDRVDCGHIRAFAEAFDPAAWTPPPPALEALRDLLGTRDQLGAMITALSNRLGCGDRNKTAAASERRALAMLRRELDRIETAIAAVIRQDPRLCADRDLLVSIPGVGPQLAAVILAEMPGPEVLCRGAEAAAYAGLNPAQRRSGTSLGASPISKVGNAVLRAALYLPALSAMRFNPVVKGFADRLRERTQLTNKQLVVAAMRKLLVLCLGVLKTRRRFDPAHAR
jgi:transposase